MLVKSKDSESVAHPRCQCGLKILFYFLNGIPTPEPKTEPQ